jgi:phosphatidylinositol alpha-1,6-mannosyltransferase
MRDQYADGAGSAIFPDLEPVHSPFNRPVLCVVVDTEEDFGWDVPLSPDNTGVASVTAQHRAQAVFAPFGVQPTYLVTYPMASDPLAVGVLREFLQDKACEVGAHLHPWVTPPGGRANDTTLSFPGNLPRRVEQEKLHRLTGAVADTFGVQPVTYKAGRYGFGPNTAALLEQEGYLIDTSLMPRTSYIGEGGPDFHDFDCGPFWFGRQRRMLELPVTRALTGSLGAAFPRLYRKIDGPVLRRSHIGSVLARSRMLERITLSPEGSDLPAMRRLTRALLARGQRIFMLQYHSPSLAPGNTPYVRDDGDLAEFLGRLAGFLTYFRDELGGEFLTPREVRDRLLRLPTPPRDARRCLVVANTFAPVHGGSAVVYESLARFGAGRVSVLAPREDYHDGSPIPGVAAFDAAAPFRVHRIRRLRTRLSPEVVVPVARAGAILTDFLIRWDVLRAIRRIRQTGGIDVLCIGELVAGGWLARAARPLLGLRAVIYVHGEEITINTSYDGSGRRRRRSLAAADGIVAVSRFTRDHLIQAYGVPREKIALISNGVDPARFLRRPKRADLLQRYGLDGGRVLLTVGRLSPRKGMDRVIEALPALRARFPSIRYLIVGEGPYRTALEEMALRFGVSDAVVFAGAVSDQELVDHYALGEVFIMANRVMPDGDTEGFGLVFLEANAMGLPVVAGDAGGSVDAVTDGVNGLVIDGDSPRRIVEAVSRLLTDDGLRASIIEQGMAVARAATWQCRVDAFLAYCDGIEASGGRR